MHMGTWVSITAVASDRQTAQDATSAGFQEIHRVEELLSTWIEGSELSRVNGAAGKGAVSVSPDTMKVLQASVGMARLTKGGFNILVGPAVEAWSVLDRQQIPSEDDLEKIRPLTNLNALQLNQAQGTVYLAKPGMRVDVGGIGKGFAADLAVEAMQRLAQPQESWRYPGIFERLANCPTVRHFHSVSGIHGTKERCWQLLIFRTRRFQRRAIMNVISSGMESGIIMSLTQ